MLKNKEIATLKYIAHSSEINKYIIGKEPIKETLLDMLDNALEANEMIKISMLKTCPNTVEEVSTILKSELGVEIVQKIGRTLIIYRESRKNKKITKLIHEHRN